MGKAMKKVLAALLIVAAMPAVAQSWGNYLRVEQRDPTDIAWQVRLFPPPPTDSLYFFNSSTIRPQMLPLGTSLQVVGGALEATGSGGTPQVNSDWSASSGVSAILNKPTLFDGAYGSLTGTPSTFAPAAHTHVATDLVSGTIADARIGALAISKTTGLQAALDSKFPIPAGTTAQYVRGDGTLATSPAAQVFNYGDPATRTIAMSTAYQASDPSKAADVSVSPQCTNTTTVLASSACTLQVRQGTSGLTCSTGTVTKQWTSTVPLGLVFTQTSGSPIEIKLGAGRYFILCPTAGTFTVPVATDQVAGL